MKPKHPEESNRRSNWDWVFDCASFFSAVLAILFTVWIPWPFGIGMVIACCALLCLAREQKSKIEFDRTTGRTVIIHTPRELRRQARRKKERERHSEMLRAQLSKPDFESRLKSFTGTERPAESDETPESKMKFWEIGGDYGKSPTRPVEILRMLLQRISKLVQQHR